MSPEKKLALLSVVVTTVLIWPTTAHGGNGFQMTSNTKINAVTIDGKWTTSDE